MDTINETKKNNKTISDAREAHLQMMLLTAVLAMLAFACGYYFAMAEVARVVSAN